VTRRIRSELLKLRTTRTTLGFLLGLLGLVAFTVVIQLVAARLEAEGVPRIEERDTQRTLFATAGSAALFAVLLGVLAVTSEFRHGTIRPTLLFDPARELVIAAKGVACSLAGLVFGVLAALLTFAIAWTWLRVDDVESMLSGREIAAILAGSVGAAVLWGAIGVGVGAVIRNQVGAIITTIVWTLIPEPLVQALVPGIGRFSPGAAADALSGAAGEHLLSPLAGLGALVLWTLAFVIAGAVVTARRDVP
jgi:ABC-type transport system involved in multi-copper enzyme maturation permease subunit